MNRIIIGLVFTFLLPGILWAQEESYTKMKDVAAFQTKLREITENTISIESDFEQEKHLSFLDETIITKGKFYFKPENKLRWEYTDPFEYLIILNENNVIIKDRQKVNQYDMQSNKIFKEINDLMIELVQGKVLNNDKYEIAYFENDQHFILELSPQLETMQQFLENIFVYFDKTDYSVAVIKMTESGDDYTRMVFMNKKLNEGIENDVFKVN